MSIDANRELAMRVFIGLAVPMKANQAIDELLIHYCHEGKCHPLDRHLTLFFLGEVKAVELRALIGEINLLQCHGPIKWHGTKIDVFPDARRPKVWALEGENTVELMALRERLLQLPSLSRLLSTPLNQSFRPHVSLIRRPNAGLVEKKVSLGIEFKRLGIYESDLSKTQEQGPRYTEIIGWDLE